MIFIQEYTMFWFGFDDARRHLFVWNIILKHDVVINYQRIPYKLENCVHFFLLPEIGTVKRRLTDNFSWGLFVWDKAISCLGVAQPIWVTWWCHAHFLKFADSHNGQDLQSVWYGIIQPSVKQKPGIRMLINCERRSLDKEKQKEKRSSQLWIILVCAFGCWQ